MWKIIAVAAGGMCGALLRYAIFNIPPHIIPIQFPYRTLIVNIVGSFVIGFMWFLVDHGIVPAALSPFVFTGLLGAFTTFSTYSLDNMLLLQRGEYTQAAVNIAISSVLGIVAVVLGFQTARLFS
ncbi:MAG: fluoride efflux transporter CrcB [Anaerolineae bacterium]|nr:fluoride efflux transporter CrcB [Anaerolineae bacterium]